MHLIKKLPLMAFVLGLGFIVVGMSSFKGEKNTAIKNKNHASIKNRDLTTQWYFVSVSGDDSDPANFTIGSTRTAPLAPANPGECRINNTGNYCSILLSFDESVNPEDLEDLTLEQAQTNYSASATDYAFQP